MLDTCDTFTSEYANHFITGATHCVISIWCITHLVVTSDYDVDKRNGSGYHHCYVELKDATTGQCMIHLITHIYFVI